MSFSAKHDYIQFNYYIYHKEGSYSLLISLYVDIESNKQNKRLLIDFNHHNGGLSLLHQNLAIQASYKSTQTHTRYNLVLNNY